MPEGNCGVILETGEKSAADLFRPLSKLERQSTEKYTIRIFFIGELSTRTIPFLLRDGNKYHSINQANALVPLITTRYIRNCRTRA